MSEVLFEFYANCGRMGSLDGLFIATQEEVDKAIGKYASFGEVLGKHSDIGFRLKADMITVKTADPAAVKVIKEILGVDVAGFNPLDYVTCEECGEKRLYCEGDCVDPFEDDEDLELED